MKPQEETSEQQQEDANDAARFYSSLNEYKRAKLSHHNRLN